VASTNDVIGAVGRPRPRALTIAGSDSGGGAGIQADLKTFAALGVYGASAVTAITAQNTTGVRLIHEVPADVVAAQVDAVLSDIGADAVKTGMLFSPAIVEAVAGCLRAHGVTRLVVDPVMVAKGGDRLLREDAIAALRDLLLPIAAVVTPNAPEASVLAGLDVVDARTAREAARRIHALGPRLVIVKGGHLGGERSEDIAFDGTTFDVLSAPRIDTPHTHGTGCTFSAAIAAGLARGASPLDAARAAKAFLQGAIEHAEPLGAGRGPVNHLWRYRDA
jgi:hydroxymethylpyrimidine/phosphomethylpyrimidine kinase